MGVVKELGTDSRARADSYVKEAFVDKVQRRNKAISGLCGGSALFIIVHSLVRTEIWTRVAKARRASRWRTSSRLTHGHRLAPTVYMLRKGNDWMHREAPRPRLHRAERSLPHPSHVSRHTASAYRGLAGLACLHLTEEAIGECGRLDVVYLNSQQPGQA